MSEPARARASLPVLLVGLALVLTGLVTGPSAQARSAAPSYDVTSATEARRVDTVPAPKVRWYSCAYADQCATVRLPRDYDRPDGPTVEVALARHRANPKTKIGTLFVNPGGPGASAVDFVGAADFVFPRAILATFDVVGVDPRGVGYSDDVRCFVDDRAQQRAYRGFGATFPFTRAAEDRYLAAAGNFGRSCANNAGPLAGSLSTAEDARDLEVIRRALGGGRLNYLGFSYGSYLGQVYANLFPDRVRTLAIDGVLDPVAWAGTVATASTPATDRLKSADGAWRALRTILKRCDKVGPKRCAFADGDPVANFARLAERLKHKPLVSRDADTGQVFRTTYADLVEQTLSLLYDEYGWAEITEMAHDLTVLTTPSTHSDQALRRAAHRYDRTRHRIERQARAAEPGSPRYAFPYDNSRESFLSVLCTDTRNPTDPSTWRGAAAAADRRAPYFGRAWIWDSASCARKTWTVRDEDAYRGPFTHRTRNPVLVVGSLWDPATNYRGAQKAAALLPNSRLLTSDNWGHTAYGTSACATRAIDTYLIKQTLPRKGKRCRGDIQPFVY